MVSVAICTYNGEKYIKEQLDSIIYQTRIPDEIILCDDKSTDNTILIASEILKKSGIKHQIYINENNIGVIENFKNAINYCKGDIIFTCDQDDVWDINKIDFISKEFEKNDKCVLVFTDAELVNKDLNPIGMKLWDSLSFKGDEFSNNNYYDILFNRCVVTGATMAVKKNLINKISCFSKYWLHDGWIAINAPLYGEVVALKKELIKYRQHENNVVGASKKTFLARCKSWIDNMNTLSEVRKTRYDRYYDFYIHNIDKLDKSSNENVSRCIEFWKEMCNIDDYGYLTSLKIIAKNLMNGNYKRYYTGFRGALRDVICLFNRKEKISID